MDENKNYAQPVDDEENEGIDIKAIMVKLWDGRKTILITLGIFIVLGVVSALTMKRTYTVSTVMVPQTGSSKSSGLSSLASLAGFDMGINSSGELSPLAYPQIMSSVPVQLKLMHTPMHFDKCDTMISMLDYALAEYEKPTVMDNVKKYTIGLPGVIMHAIVGDKKDDEVVVPESGDDTPRPVVVSQDEYKMMESFKNILSLAVDKKEGMITLTTHGREPLQTAELALHAQQLLQDEVTRMQMEKSQSELDYIQARFDEAKADAERLQGALAGTTDKYQNLVTTSATVGKQRLQTKYNVANTIYMELAKQLEQAKMQVKKDMPVFAVIQPVTIPMKPDNSRAKTVVIWTFLGVLLGCGIVLIKDYWPTFKDMFKKKEEEKEEPELTAEEEE